MTDHTIEVECDRCGASWDEPVAVDVKRLAEAMGYSDPALGTDDDMILFDWHRHEDDPELRLAAAKVVASRLGEPREVGESEGG